MMISEGDVGARLMLFQLRAHELQAEARKDRLAREQPRGSPRDRWPTRLRRIAGAGEPEYGAGSVQGAVAGR